MVSRGFAYEGIECGSLSLCRVFSVFHLFLLALPSNRWFRPSVYYSHSSLERMLAEVIFFQVSFTNARSSFQL